MPSDLNAPGLKKRPNKDGTVRLYWAARADLVKAGYEPETVRLSFDLADPTHHPLIEAACLRYQAEMLEWASGRRGDPNRFDGTIKGLSRRFQTDPTSPFVRRWKWKTREKETYTLAIIEKAFGARALAALKGEDFVRWYEAARKPKAEGKPERVRRAWGIMKVLRAMFRHGVVEELAECARLDVILSELDFEQPSGRREKLEAHHVEAFAVKAVEAGRLSLALATAIQFETALRQVDVIGEWEPIPQGEAPTGIVLGKRRWVNGLTWSDLADGYTVRKDTTKTGAGVAHDLTACPIVMRLLALVPTDKRVGPLIVDETAGRPYATSAFGREWRPIARAAGIPNRIWNMDARAGAVSEADEAGAATDAIRAQTGHTQARTTERYKRGGNLSGSRAVAELRVAHRATRNNP